MEQGRRSATVVVFFFTAAVVYAAHCYEGQPEDPVVAVAERMAAYDSWRIILNNDGDNFETRVPQLDGGVTRAQRPDVELISLNYFANDSRVDAVFLNMNARVTYLPLPPDAGTLRGSISTPAQRAAWASIGLPRELTRWSTQQWMQNGARDPYVDMIRDVHGWGRPVFMSYRVNDSSHAYEPLRPQFWYDNSGCRLGGAGGEGLDFNCSTVVDYNVNIIIRALAYLRTRGACLDGVELDFNRTAPFSSNASQATKISQITGFVTRVKDAVDAEAALCGRTMLVAIRVPANSADSTAPTPTEAKSWGVDARALWDAGLIHLMTVSSYLTQRPSLGIATWRTEMGPTIPIYGGLEHLGGDASPYLTVGAAVKAEGANGCYLFNFLSSGFLPPHRGHAGIPYEALASMCP